jgi:hypothetical protein
MSIYKEAHMVWFCEYKEKCKWQCFALHRGLSWGRIPNKNDPWRKWHDKECGGKLRQVSFKVYNQEGSEEQSDG